MEMISGIQIRGDRAFIVLVIASAAAINDDDDGSRSSSSWSSHVPPLPRHQDD